MADQEQKQPTKKSRTPKTKSAYALALEKVQGEQTNQTEEQPNIQPSEQKTSQPAKGDTTIQTANHSNSKTEKQSDTKTAGQTASQLSQQADSKPGRQQRTKATYYLNMEDIISIDTIQTKRFRATGKKPEKSELVSEAIQLLSKQENI
ncbi:MAG TPA: hypothetical protein VGE97_01735 [Nitrososphaera sp.]